MLIGFKAIDKGRMMRELEVLAGMDEGKEEGREVYLSSLSLSTQPPTSPKILIEEDYALSILLLKIGGPDLLKVLMLMCMETNVMVVGDKAEEVGY